jgi:predicted nucleic acid-binding protein
MIAGGYLLDTNFVSELRKPRPDPNVLAFMAAAESAALFLSVLTLGELRKGIAAKRRQDPAAADRLAAWAAGIETLFEDRVLPVDAVVARLWGDLSAAGSVPAIDGLIAATALRHGLTLVTRNTKDFQTAGVQLLNPWQ